MFCLSQPVVLYIYCLLHITADKDYRQQSAVSLDSETHGGEDVGIYARGPMSHMFHGVHENIYIAHVMAYASCVGDYSQLDQCAQADVNAIVEDVGNNSRSLRSGGLNLLFIYVLFMLLWLW